MAEKKTLHVRILLGFTLVCLLATLFVPAIPQPPEFHQFADSRAVLGIPNFLNIITNLLFLVGCIYGLKLLFDPRPGSQRTLFESQWEAISYLTFFVGAGLTSFASMYYHWSPDNASLVWDRLAMTVIFTSFLTIMIAERINQRIGLALLPVFLALGIFSVYYWYQSELAGMGDLRLYLIIQFLPAPLILYMLFFMPSRYSRSSRFGWILAIYVLAKLSEYFDRQIFELQHWISGHSIKHILAAFAVFMLAEMLRCRIPVKRNRQLDSELDQY